MIYPCREPVTHKSVQTKSDIYDEKKKKDKEIEVLMSEKDSEVRALKNQLKVRNVVMFHINLTGTLTCVFLCMISMWFSFCSDLPFS